MKRFLQVSVYFLLFAQTGFAQWGCWTKVGDMPENRYGHTVDEINGKIYIVGGVNYEFSAYPRTALVYDRSSGEWAQIPLPKNKSRWLHTSCVVDGKLYIIGGNDSTWTVSTTDMFDPGTGKWESKKSMSIDRGAPACVALDGKIYVMGGGRAKGMSVYSDLNTVEVYDTISDTWTRLADMPRKRWAHSAVAVNGKIYVCGGRADSQSFIYYASVDMYDPQTNTWTSQPAMPHTKSSFTACLLDGDIFTIGGWVNSISPLYNFVDVYHPDRQEWKTESPMPVKRSILASIVLDGKIFIYGGTRTNHPLTGTSDIYECSFVNTYAYDGALDHHYARPGLDTVCVTAMLANPVHHTAMLSAVLTDNLGAVRDSVLLYDDGLHGDGSSGDSLWGCQIPAPADEGLFRVDVRTDDITQGTFHKVLIPMHFTTAGPVILDSMGVTKPASKYYLKPYLRNNGKAFTIHGARLALTCTDSWFDSVDPLQVNLPDLASGATSAANDIFSMALNTAPFPGYFNVKADFSIDGWIFWTDSMRVYVTSTGVADKNEGLPAAFALEQNFPNPFNTTTTIRYTLPNRSKVTLTVFNILGEEVIKLVDGVKEAGYHEVQFNGMNLVSGVYFCRLQAGEFSQSRKLTMIR